MLEKIKQNVFNHFKCLPEAVGFSVKTDQTLTIVNCGLGSSMFNIVCGDYYTKKVQSVVNEFKDQPFAWWISPINQVKSVKSKIAGARLRHRN